MNATWILGASFVLFLIALPLVSLGATQGNPALWWTGLALMVVAGAAPPVTRYVGGDGEDEEGEGEGKDGGVGEDKGKRKREATQEGERGMRERGSRRERWRPEEQGDREREGKR